MCGEELEASTLKRRNPRLIIYNVPDELIIKNAKELIMKKQRAVYWKRRHNTKVSLQDQQFSDRGQFYEENEVLGEENEIMLEHV